MRTMKRSMVALAAMLLVTGATWCLAREMQVPAEYPTIQAAIEAAQDGDTILIAPGTYRENLAVAKNITLVGADRDTVILDGGGSDVVTVASGGALVLKSLTVTNGREGISVRRGGRIALINVRVVANKRDGVLVMGTAELQGCLVRDSGRYGVNVFGPGAQILGSGNILWNNLEGNIQGETPTTFQVPAGPPTPRVGLAPDAWTNVNRFTLTIGADYPAQIVATWYKMRSPPTSATDGTRLAGLQFTVESPAEGAVPMWVWIEDELGLKDHRKAVRVVLKWDTTPPVIVAKITPEPNSAGWNNSDVVVSFECIDALSGMASCTPGEPVSLTQEGKGQVVKAVAVDNAGNKAEREVVVNLDKTRPEIVLGAPRGTLGIENWYRSDVTVPYTATDTLSGFPGGKTTTEGTVTTTGEGPDRTVVIRVTDLAGNTAEAKAGPFKVDKTPPVARIVLDPATPNGKEGWYTMPVKVHYECSDPLSGLDPATPPPSDTTLTTDGIHHLTLEVRDKAGNAAPVVTVDVKLDQTPPVVRATPPDTTRWYREDVQVPCTASDATSGLANSGDANFTLLAKGEGRAVSTGTRTVADRAGNTTTVGPFTFQIDKNPPVIVAKITPEPNSAGWNNSDVVVSFECIDALSGMASCSPPVTLTREGRDQVVQGEAVDNAGNRATTSLKLNLDKTAPSGSLAILADEGFETGDFALLPWRSGGSLPWVVQSSVVRSGSYAARAGAIGHNSSSWLELNLSLGAGTVSFWYRVSSESGYDYLRFYVDGVEKAKWSGETGWQYASLSVTAGTHTLRWEYSKDSSVVAGSDTAWLDDIRLPVSASPSVRVSEPVVALALSAQDNLSGVAEARFSNDGQSWSAWETFASTKGSWDLTAFGGTRTLGLKTIHAQVRDRAGNASAAFTVSFRLISIPYLGHTGLVRAVAFSPDGKSIVSGSWDDTIRVWEVASGSAVSVLARHTSDVNAVAFSPDGKILASASDDRTVRVWDAATGRELQSLRSHTDSVMAVAFSPDGKYVASGSKDKTIRLWDVATGQLVKTITGHAGTVTSLVYLGSWRLASGSEDGTVILWEMPTGWKERTLQGHTAGVNAVAYSAETRLLASGSSDKTIRLWDAFTGESKGVLTGHTDSVLSVQFSPNGKFLVSGSADRTVRVWDVATGQVLRVLVGHTDAVMSVGYSPDGKVVVSGSRDGTVRLWDVSDLVGR